MLFDRPVRKPRPWMPFLAVAVLASLGVTSALARGVIADRRLGVKEIQAIADEVELRLKAAGMRPTHVEGYKQAEWVLIDYVDFVVHVFSEKARKFYDLERLWKSAKVLEPTQLKVVPRNRKIAAHSAERKKKRA